MLLFFNLTGQVLDRHFKLGHAVLHIGLRGLIASLHDELGRSPVRVSGLYPGPLRTALRARAYSVDQDPAAQGPEAAAAAAVTLLSGAGSAWRGQILDASGMAREK